MGRTVKVGLIQLSCPPIKQGPGMVKAVMEQMEAKLGPFIDGLTGTVDSDWTRTRFAIALSFFPINNSASRRRADPHLEALPHDVPCTGRRFRD